VCRRIQRFTRDPGGTIFVTLQGMTSIDRRKHPRVTVSVDVDFESGSNFYSGKARDMSEGGVFVESLVFAPVGTRIELALKLFGHRYDVPVEVTWILYDGVGTVVGFGARFLELRRPVRRAITEFMRARAPMPFEILEVEEDVEETPPPQAATIERAPGVDRSPTANARRRRSTLRLAVRRGRVGPPPLPAFAGGPVTPEKAGSDIAGAGVDSDRMVN
jgi:Tfp pilus assembly protein PilZ